MLTVSRGYTYTNLYYYNPNLFVFYLIIFQAKHNVYSTLASRITSSRSSSVTVKKN